MHVKMLVHISGVRDGRLWPAIGEVADLPDGAELVEQGLAEAAEARAEKRPAPSAKVEKRA